MNILIINNDYPPYIFGGIGTFVHELAKSLSQRNHRVTVITGRDLPLTSMSRFPSFERYSDGNIDVIRFSYPGIAPRQTLFQLWNWKRIVRVMDDLHIDIIHGQSGSTYPLLSNLKKKAPVLVTFHTSPQMEKIYSVQSIFRGGSKADFWKFTVGYPAWNLPYWKELEGCDKGVAVSNCLRCDLLSEMGQKYDEKLSSIYNGVDLQSLDTAYEQAGGNSECEKNLFFAGRLYWRKGALNLIKLAYFLKRKKTDYRIIVHGTGPMLGKMRGELSSLGLNNIELRGFTTKRQLMESMRNCKFVVIPSFYEACPMILLESMCLGKIPLLLNVPFAFELTENGKYGIMADTMEKIADKLSSIENQMDICDLSKKIRVFARTKYDINNTVKAYTKLYHKLK